MAKNKVNSPVFVYNDSHLYFKHQYPHILDKSMSQVGVHVLPERARISGRFWRISISFRSMLPLVHDVETLFHHQ